MHLSIDYNIRCLKLQWIMPYLDQYPFKPYTFNKSHFSNYFLLLFQYYYERRVPKKKRDSGTFLGHLSFWVSDMESPLIFIYTKK